MRLKEIYIERYGPLNSLRLEFKPGVQPIFGDNESGKTLLVDCIIKMLSGKGAGWDPLLDRVEEEPVGFIILEEDNKELKLEKGRSLADYLSISPEELRNVFIIREADLEIPEQNVFYEKVTDKITGLRSEDIRKIVEKLREIGRLTVGNSLSDAKNLGKPKSQLEEARKLSKDIKNYLEEAEKKNILHIEAEIFQTKTKESLLGEKIELLKKAREKERFLNLQSRLLDAKGLLKKFREKPSAETLSTLQGKLNDCLQEEAKKPFFQRINQYSKTLSFISVPLTSIAWAVLFTFGFTSIADFVLPLVLLISLLFSSTIFYYSNRKLSNIEKNQRELFMEGERFGIVANTIGELADGLGKLFSEIQKLRSMLDQNIGVLRDSLNISAGDDEEVLKIAEAELSNKMAIIDLNVKIKFDEEELKKAEAELSILQQELKRLYDRLSEHKEVLKKFSERAYKLEFSRFIGAPLDVELENIESLKLLDKKLEEFSHKIENDAELCKLAIEIFEEMGKEEEAKIEELFGENSVASQIFQEITEGRYSKVVYDSTSKEIIVIRPSGEKFPASKLSKGTFDQLYMSIRIDLAQRILGGKKGFFVMDDAFLSSGPRRLKKALDIIRKLSNMGWSVIYFAVKLEDAKMLAEVSGNNVIELSPLP